MKKILLIEDDEALRENIAEMLVISNYTVISAADGKKGIEAALKENPDLILCDVMMPGLDGYGVLHILSRHPDASHIPFVFLTGKNELEDLRKGLGMGADGYLVKPFHETELLNTVDLRLKKCEQRRTHHDLFRNTETPDRTGVVPANLLSADHERICFKKKHVLYAEDQRANSTFYVLSGRVKEYRMHENGKELITNIYSTGDFFGHTAVLEGVNYSESAEVIDDATLIVIPAKEFSHLIQTDANLAQQFLGLLSHDVRKKEEKLLNMAYNSLRKKVAAGIIEVADKFTRDTEGLTTIPISREDLAHVVGSAQESMIRTLKEFKTEKLIDIRDGHIVILNDQKLRNLLY